jgi:integrase/recombinase XerD
MMITNVSDTQVSSLRQRMIEDMNLRRFARQTQFDYVRQVARFATYLGRPPDTATAEDLRLFQLEQRDAGLGVPTMNSIVLPPRRDIERLQVSGDLLTPV